MSAISKSIKLFALVAALSAGSAMAGQGSCMPMSMPMQMPMQMPMMQGASGCAGAEANQTGPQSCPLQDAKAQQDQGCAGNGGGLSAKLGDMASGGMNIAMTVIGSIFGSPAK